MALNICAVSILRQSAGILKRNKNELQEMDRKFMKMNKKLHLRSDADVPMKNSGRGLIGCENSYQLQSEQVAP